MYHKPRDFKQINTFDSSNANHLAFAKSLGISVSDSIGMDANESFINGGVAANISNLRQFLPGIVRELTTVRKIDELLGQVTIGKFEDEEILQMTSDRAGTIKPYADGVDVPFTSYNMDFERRSIVRFVIGMKSDFLADKRIDASGGNPEESKRTAAATALEIVRNEIGFYGYNNGSNRTYGYLNDPNLPAYQTLANGAGGTPQWSTKTYEEKQADIVTAISSLQVTTGGNFDPSLDEFTFALPLSQQQQLNEENMYGRSIRKYLSENYPKCRIIAVPELDNANGGLDVFYMYAETLRSDSTDNGRVFDQLVVQKMMSIGRGQEIGGYKEGFVNACAGVLMKRPYAVYRGSGM